MNIKTYAELHTHFWQRHPAFLSALSILVGSSAPLFWDSYLWPIFWSIYLLFSRYPIQILLVLGSITYGYLQKPPPVESKIQTAIFSPSCVKPHQSPFQKGLAYTGTLNTASGPIPCSIYLHSNTENRPLADVKYYVTGSLQQRGPYDYMFKTEKWDPIPGSWSLAELRYQTKESLRKILNENLSNRRNASFLSSLITGDVEDRLLRFEFGRLGLQHILAISGFHFGILISFCSFCFGLFLPRTWKIGALFIVVNLYFFFVGSSPAVQRSWLSALFYLLGQYLNRSSPSLNILGCALGVELILDPLVSGHLGFQLSFLSCIGILMFQAPIDQKLQTIFPKRDKKSALKLSRLEQHVYILSSFFRQAVSLTLAVNITLLPLLLYHFHQFPFLSLIYNLFFPFLVGIDLFLLLLALIFHLLFPPAGYVLYFLTDSLTTQLLDFASYPPLALNYSLQIQEISAWMIPVYLLVLVAVYPWIESRLTNRDQFI